MKPKLTPFTIDPELKTYDLKYKLDYLIPVNYGHGIRWKDKEGQQCVSVLREGSFDSEGRRIARLHETNLLYSIGASHYYASVEACGPDGRNLTTGDTFCMGGYGPERDKIECFIGSIRIEAQRVLTRLEKDMNGEKIGKVGDRTYRFNSEQEARAAGIKTFLERFGPGWALYEEDDYTKLITESKNEARHIKRPDGKKRRKSPAQHNLLPS